MNSFRTEYLLIVVGVAAAAASFWIGRHFHEVQLIEAYKCGAEDARGLRIQEEHRAGVDNFPYLNDRFSDSLKEHKSQLPACTAFHVEHHVP